MGEERKGERGREGKRRGGEKREGRKNVVMPAKWRPPSTGEPVVNGFRNTHTLSSRGCSISSIKIITKKRNQGWLES